MIKFTYNSEIYYVSDDAVLFIRDGGDGSLVHLNPLFPLPFPPDGPVPVSESISSLETDLAHLMIQQLEADGTTVLINPIIVHSIYSNEENESYTDVYFPNDIVVTVQKVASEVFNDIQELKFIPPGKL